MNFHEVSSLNILVRKTKIASNKFFLLLNLNNFFEFKPTFILARHNLTSFEDQLLTEASKIYFV